MSSTDNISLVAIKPRVLSSLHKREDLIDVPGHTPEVGERGLADRQNIGVTGFCECYDLSKEGDRSKYAELSANLAVGTEYVKIWEERVVTGESIKIFINYVRYINVNQTSIQPIKLKD